MFNSWYLKEDIITYVLIHVLFMLSNTNLMIIIGKIVNDKMDFKDCIYFDLLPHFLETHP